MEKEPGFIKDFAKEQSAAAEPTGEGLSPRQELAREIKAKRAEYFDRQKVLESTMSEINELTVRLKEISDTVPKKIMHYLEYRKLQAELEQRTEEHKKLAIVEPELKEDELSIELQEGQKMLEDYYAKTEKEWTEADFDTTEMEKYFTTENLSSLSTEDYELLLSRFPGKMVTHVTRQGIKDHTPGGVYAMFMGTSDTEGHLRTGFTDMLEEGGMKSITALAITDSEKRDMIFRQFFEGCSIREEAIARLDRALADEISPGERGMSYSDKSALHFAAGEVLDEYYGGETGNEIFIAYPTYLIANEYHASNFREGGGVHNDVFVWQRENKGIPLDAGVVFIPKSTSVSPESGSKYDLDDEGKPEVSQDNVAAIERLINNNIVKEILNSEGENPELKKRLTTNFGLSEELADMLLSDNQYYLVGALTKETYLRTHGYSPEQDELIPDEGYRKEALEDIRTLLANHQLLFRRASNPVTSEAYWEKYFAEHPDQKPAHIIYYDGDPTTALGEWQESSGITKQDRSEKIDLDSRTVQSGSPEALSGSEEFRGLMLGLIEERFPEKAEAVA